MDFVQVVVASTSESRPYILAISAAMLPVSLAAVAVAFVQLARSVMLSLAVSVDVNRSVSFVPTTRPDSLALLACSVIDTAVALKLVFLPTVFLVFGILAELSLPLVPVRVLSRSNVEFFKDYLPL